MIKRELKNFTIKDIQIESSAIHTPWIDIPGREVIVFAFEAQQATICRMNEQEIHEHHTAQPIPDQTM